MKSKKIVSLLLSAVTLFSLTACGNTNTTAEDPIEKYGSDTLKLYNWGEYMGDTLISDFEKQFGVNVIVEYFDSNEMMYTKIQAGDSYDVLVPSDYMIERLLSNNSLQPLDKEKIQNFSNLAEGVKHFLMTQIIPILHLIFGARLALSTTKIM